MHVSLGLGRSTMPLDANSLSSVIFTESAQLINIHNKTRNFNIYSSKSKNIQYHNIVHPGIRLAHHYNSIRFFPKEDCAIITRRFVPPPICNFILHYVRLCLEKIHAIITYLNNSSPDALTGFGDGTVYFMTKCLTISSSYTYDLSFS